VRLVEPFRRFGRLRGIWRSVLLGAVLAGLVAGCGGGGEASCAALLHWQGHTYRGESVSADLRLSVRPVGVAQVPGCVDVPAGQSGGGGSVKVYRIVGVSVSMAVAVRGQPCVKYLRDSGT
jgi:hypothetical protein